MSVPKDPIAAAAKVKTELAAARLNDDLETELGMGTPAPEWAHAAEAARDDLASRFGGFDRLHDVDTTKRSGPDTGHVHGGRRRRSSSSTSSKTSAAPAGTPGKPPTTPAGRGRAPAGSSGKAGARGSAKRSSAGGAARSFAGDVADVSGATAAGSLVMYGLSGTVALVLLFVLIKGKGKGDTWTGAQALARASEFFVNGLHLFMAPVDPLGGQTARVNAAADAAVRSSPGASPADTSGAGGGGTFAPSIRPRSPASRQTGPATNAAGKALP